LDPGERIYYLFFIYTKVKKQLITVGVILASIGAGAAIVSPVLAANSTRQAEMSKSLAAKLGVSEEKVTIAMEAIRSEQKATRQAEMKTKLAAAVVSGKLTQRQADLLTASGEIRSTLAKPDQSERESLKDLTEAQRKTKMDEMHTKRVAEMVTALNAKGLNTNADELKAAQTAARSADLIPEMGGRGPREMR